MTAHRSVPTHWPWLRVWRLSHGLSWFFVAGLAIALTGGALGTHVAGHRVAPESVLLGERGHDPALLAPLVLAAACGLPAIVLRDSLAWLTDVGAQPVRVHRARWACCIVLAVHVLAAAVQPLASSRVDLTHVYWCFLPMWLGCMLLGSWAGGPLAGSVTPLAVCVAFSLRVVPWEANIVFNPALLTARWTVGLLLLGAGTAAYACHGARRRRGQLPDD